MKRPVADASPSPGRGLRTTVAFAAMSAALVLAVSGDGSDPASRIAEPRTEVAGSTPAVHHLVGTWREARPGGALVRFDRDGTFAVDTGKLDPPYDAAGTYALDGDTIAFASNGSACASSWKWRVGIAEGSGDNADELDVVLLSGWCQRPRGEEHTFLRVTG